MKVKFKNFTRENVIMTAADGHQALVTGGTVVTLDEKFTHELDHTKIRQITFPPVVPVAAVAPEMPALADTDAPVTE
jgi:hypothetical protein